MLEAAEYQKQTNDAKPECNKSLVAKQWTWTQIETYKTFTVKTQAAAGPIAHISLNIYITGQHQYSLLQFNTVWTVLFLTL